MPRPELDAAEIARRDALRMLSTELRQRLAELGDEAGSDAERGRLEREREEVIAELQPLTGGFAPVRGVWVYLRR